MSGAELLVNVTPSETRVALVENGLLKELHIEREAKRGIVGNIYKGRVTRVLPGMQSAFVDIGLEKRHFYTLPILFRTRNVWMKTRRNSLS
ncbi:ribonuclease G [Actinobacillus equuli]|nr:ribonuclease G [Actinobacillus equuli]